ESRTSTLVVDPTSGTQTEINEWGPKVTESELGILMDKLRYLSRGAEAVVFAGSLPRGVSETFYADAARELGRRGVRVALDTEGVPLRGGVGETFYGDAARELGRRGVRVALDTEGEPLRRGLEAEPWLVSPNQHEAEQLVGQELFHEQGFVSALRGTAG